MLKIKKSLIQKFKNLIHNSALTQSAVITKKAIFFKMAFKLFYKSNIC